MDFKRRVRIKIDRKPELEDLETAYPHNIMFYKYPPKGEIKMQEFEDLALDRLKVLRILDEASLKSVRFFSDEYKEFVTSELNREGLKGYARLLNGNAVTKKEIDLQARRQDHVSHFILRIAYCSSTDLKRWFLKNEMDMFRYKFSSLTSNEVKQFLELNKMDYIPLTEEQKNEVKDGLYESTFGQSANKIELLDFYKVFFTEVLDLVRSRRCYVKNGFAYVNTHNFMSILVAKHYDEIDYGLTVTRDTLLPDIPNDSRIFSLMKCLPCSYTGKNYTISENSVPIESLEQLSKTSYPLCMRHCHEKLKTDHHLKYGGRMQYGLFLKSIGVTLEDALRFWRDEFTKKIDLEKFEKSYAYNIRHNYGKEGSKVNYAPYSCMKIIKDTISHGDTHGCPFRHFDEALLKSKLSSYSISWAHVQEIMSYVEKEHYHIACMKFFEASHGTKLNKGISHPNEFFELSQKVLRKDQKGLSTKLVNTQNSSNVKDSKSTSKTFKKNSETLLNTNDDDELWNVAETQESDYKIEEIKSKWDEDDFETDIMES